YPVVVVDLGPQENLKVTQHVADDESKQDKSAHGHEDLLADRRVAEGEGLDHDRSVRALSDSRARARCGAWRRRGCSGGPGAGRPPRVFRVRSYPSEQENTTHRNAGSVMLVIEAHRAGVH